MLRRVVLIWRLFPPPPIARKVNWEESTVESNPTRFHLRVRRKTARDLGLQISKEEGA